MVSEDQNQIPVSRPLFAYPVSPTDGPRFSRRICFKNMCRALINTMFVFNSSQVRMNIRRPNARIEDYLVPFATNLMGCEQLI